MSRLLGTQGWAYRAWAGPFYPDGLSSSKMLAFYSKEFGTVEVDETFYGLPPEKVVVQWKESVSSSFVFSLKVPQQITHDRRLVNSSHLLARFIDRVRLLESRLGVLLLQMSPDFVATPENRAVFEEFLPSLDRDLRWAIEFRHGSWFDQSILSLLRRRGIAVVLADGRWFTRERLFEMARDPTARFLYVRWMGQGPCYTDFGSVQDDRADVLGEWATLVNAVTGRFDAIYGYFNNRFEGYAPNGARGFERLLQNPSEEKRRFAAET